MRIKNDWCKIFGEGKDAILVAIETDDGDPCVSIKVKFGKNKWGAIKLAVETWDGARQLFEEIEEQAAQEFRDKMLEGLMENGICV